MKKIVSYLLLGLTIVFFQNCNKSNNNVDFEQEEEEEVVEEELPNKYELVSVQGGSFEMGSNDGLDRETPIHTVTLNTFKISKYEITHALFIEFLNDISCNSNGRYEDSEFGNVKYIEMEYGYSAVEYSNNSFYFKKSDHASTPNCPIISVSWYGANAFCKWAGGRLPTEAEWEFAARGGNNSLGYTYSGSDNLDEVAWNLNNSGHETHPVGQKSPNELGLYDMTGNLWEWCSDWYSDNYYSVSPLINPQGPPESGHGRIQRGGSYESDEFGCRTTMRYSEYPLYGYRTVGFRMVVP